MARGEGKVLCPSRCHHRAANPLPPLLPLLGVADPRLLWLSLLPCRCKMWVVGCVGAGEYQHRISTVPIASHPIRSDRIPSDRIAIHTKTGIVP